MSMSLWRYPNASHQVIKSSNPPKLRLNLFLDKLGAYGRMLSQHSGPPFNLYLTHIIILRNGFSILSHSHILHILSVGVLSAKC